MYLPCSLTLTATDGIKKHDRGEGGGKETKQKADISKGEDIEIRSEEVGTRRE